MSLCISDFLYLTAAVFFILSLQGLSSARTALKGLWMGIAGMLIAIFVTLCSPLIEGYGLIFAALLIGGAIGYGIVPCVPITALPQLIAAFHSLVGLAAVFVAGATLGQAGADVSAVRLLEMGLGAGIGAITFTGSVVAFAKLQGLIKGTPFQLPWKEMLNLALGVGIFLTLLLFMATGSTFFFLGVVFLSFALGIFLILPIGGADMPVVVSMLNSYSGWAAAGIGFTISNTLLIIVGALVGSSGAILSYIMCKGMNRSIFQVILGGLGSEATASGVAQEGNKTVRQGGAEDAAFVLQNAGSVIIVPGYGVAGAQHVLKELALNLKARGIDVRYAIHPVAGRMPGHMNVLLAEAGVDYDDVKELEEINSDFANTDVVIVIGANDITNPVSRTDASSPIYKMPILDVDKARQVLFVKRSLSPGYAGIDNPLFYSEKTMMVFGDAKSMCETMIKALDEG